jgi:hypothetical protein
MEFAIPHTVLTVLYHFKFHYILIVKLLVVILPLPSFGTTYEFVVYTHTHTHTQTHTLSSVLLQEQYEGMVLVSAQS